MLSKNIKETTKIAKIFLNKIFKKDIKKGAMVVGMIGDLGVGKTAFVREIALQLDVKNKITSPTFVIIKNYKLRNTKYKKLFHI
ncbi:MAG: tRNA (adenosine(37)-N6)-threonylcarbamoyltransferase complex ATPase subunit type 1 TsaE, partial [bacterium]